MAYDFVVERKVEAGPVTWADREADALLKSRLLAIVEADWLCEETADAPQRHHQSRAADR